MRVSISELSSAIDKIKSFADSTQHVPGILLDFRGEELRVCYTNGKRAIIEKISVAYDVDEEEFHDELVVGFDRMISVIDICKPSGEILATDMDITIAENNILHIEAVKTMLVNRMTGNFDEEGNAEYVEEAKVVSKVKNLLQYHHTDDNIRYKILDRMDYDSIFLDADGNGAFEDDIGKFDIWDKAELKKILSKTAIEKNKSIYVSSQVGGGFSVTNAYVVFVPSENTIANGVVLASGMAKTIADILNKIDDDKVRICRKDNRFMTLINGTDTIGVWLELPPASKTDLSTLNQYAGKEYNSFEMVFSRSALMNVVSCAATLTKDERSHITFGEVDGIKSLIVSAGNGAGDFNVTMEGNQNNIGNWEELSKLEINISLNVLSNMLSQCESTYISMDLSVDDSNKFLRLAELHGRDDAGNKVFGTTYYTVVSR